MKEIDAIEKPGKRLTFTPRSEQELFAELHLMRVTHEEKNALMANDAWRAAFLPVGGLVECQATKKCWLDPSDSPQFCGPPFRSN